MSTSHSLALEDQTPSDAEIDKALWSAYKFILDLGRRRKERLAREAAEQSKTEAIEANTNAG